ncbi:MAG TPA: hypothetical protein VK035_04320 [Kiloniellales bacterium]|nr:hypothetical protein [Kiloniellales bacterium]
MSQGTGLELRPVRTRRDIKAFGDAARTAQGQDPNWVGWLDEDLDLALNPRRSIFVRENDVQGWVALRDGRAVGRILAVRNRAHLDKYQDATGQFGFLEGIDERRLFAALTQCAASWLRKRGLQRMQGPFSASINHEAGLLVEGFEQPPMMRTNHAQPWYAHHLENLGFCRAADLQAYLCRPAESRYPERVRMALARWSGRRRLRLVTMSRRHFQRDMAIVNDIYNDAWADNWNAIPVGEQEARLIARAVRPLLRLDWITLGYWDEEPIAVVSQVPNINEATADLQGKLLPFGWAKLLWRLKIRGLKSSRIPMIGLRRRWQGTRVGGMAVAALMARALENAQRARVERLEISWMLANNRQVLNLCESLPARHYKTFRIFEKSL